MTSPIRTHSALFFRGAWSSAVERSQCCDARGSSRAPFPRIRMTSIALMAGVVSTVAIAWLCAAVAELRPVVLDNRELQPWSGRHGSNRMGVEYRGLGVSVVMPQEIEFPFDDDVGDRWCGATRAGLPFASLAASAPPSAKAGFNDSRDGITIRDSHSGRGAPVTRVLPLRPLAPGFVADTLIFATAFLALGAFVRMLRSHARLRRGLCPECRHVTINAPRRCAECG